MTTELIIQWSIIIIVALGFILSIAYLMTHNPNYSWKEIIRNPWKIFDLINHAKQLMDDKIQDMKEEVQETIDDIKEIKEQVDEGTEVITTLKEAIDKTVEEIDNIVNKDEN